MSRVGIAGRLVREQVPAWCRWSSDGWWESRSGASWRGMRTTRAPHHGTLISRQTLLDRLRNSALEHLLSKKVGIGTVGLLSCRNISARICRRICEPLTLLKVQLVVSRTPSRSGVSSRGALLVKKGEASLEVLTISVGDEPVEDESVVAHDSL